MFLPVTLFEDALVHVHRAARLAGHRLGHEGGEHLVAQRRLADGALEEEHLVGQAQRVVVEEVDLHLAGADLVDQRVDVELHLFAVGVDVLEQRVELVHRVDRVGLARGLGAAAAAARRAQRRVRVGVALDQVELELGRDHRAPALGVVEVADAAQHRTRRIRDHLAVAVEAVVDDLRGRVGGPGHDAHRARVGAQVHVAVGRVDHVVVRAFLGEFAGHADGDDRLRQPHAAVLGEFLARQDLAARHAGEVGHEALDLRHASFIEPLFEFGEAEIAFVNHESPESWGTPGREGGMDGARNRSRRCGRALTRRARVSAVAQAPDGDRGRRCRHLRRHATSVPRSGWWRPAIPDATARTG